VVAFVWDDLDDPDPPPPAWFDESAAPILMQEPALALKPAHVDLMKRGPLDLVVSWVQSPDPDGLRAIGRAIPLLLAVRAQQKGAVDEGAPLATTAVDLLDGGGFPSSGDTAWSWQDESVLAVARTIGATHETGVALVLDDAKVAAPGGIRKSWRTWLGLSNLLGLRTAETELTVRSLVVSGAPSAPVAAAPSLLPDAWAAVLEQATVAEVEFLEALAHEAIPVPEYGPEVDGIPLGPSWVESKVTVDVDLGDAERDALTASGWTLVPMVVEDVRDALGAEVG
jgi:hypothetical protein